MLRSVIICPNQELSAELRDVLEQTRGVAILRTLDSYPNEVDLVRFLRATAPEIVFLSVELPRQALPIAAAIEVQAPGTQVMAISRSANPDALMETMRAGIREFLAPPFEAEAIRQALDRAEQVLEHKPAAIESTDAVFAFLPSKPGVGCSTIALNTSMMLSQLPDK